MKKTIIVMRNNWLFDINGVLKFEDIDIDKLLSIHAEYYPKSNETHIVVYTTE